MTMTATNIGATETTCTTRASTSIRFTAFSEVAPTESDRTKQIPNTRNV